LRELAQRPNPFTQLLVGVEIVESLGSATAPLVPRRRVAAVDANGSGSARERRHRRDEILGSLEPRSVDDHVRSAELLQEPQGVVAMILVEPARVPELHEHLVVSDLLARPLQVLERAVLVDHIRGKLEEDPAELATGAQRLECDEESSKDLTAKLPGRPLDSTPLVCLRLVTQIRR